MKVFLRGLNACIQRKADIKRYRQYLAENGHELVGSPEEAETILLWTCSYRRDQHDNSLRLVDEYGKLPGELVVCGCLPSIDPAGLRHCFKGRAFEWKNQYDWMPALFGTSAPDLAGFERGFMERSIPKDLATYKQENPHQKVTYSDQFLKMYPSEGCKQTCAYCAERMAFPAYRSIPVQSLVDRSRALMEETGQRRLVLWADSLGDYGHDMGESLPGLVRALLAIDPAVEIGLENMHPVHALGHLPFLLELLDEGRLFLLKVPIQSASGRVLSLMRRNYDRADIERLFGAVMGTGFKNFETDVIAGFPTETGDEFLETLDFVTGHRVKYVLLSGYLETPGMDSAAIFPKVPQEEIARRLELARERLGLAGIFYNDDNSSSAKERFEKDFVDFG